MRIKKRRSGAIAALVVLTFGLMGSTAAHADWNEEARIVGPNTGTHFPGGGSSRGLAVHGDVLVVGEAHDDAGVGFAGQVHVYTSSGGVWTLEQTLTASDGAAGDRFGWAVAFDGTYIVVSAPHDAGAAFRTGSVYVFAKSGGTWVQETKLTGPGEQTQDRYGWSLGIDGDRFVVGVRFDDDQGLDSGSAYVYARDSGGTWAQEAKLLGSGGSTAGYFGTSVDMDGDRVVVGAPGKEASYVFARSGTSWSEEVKLTASDTSAGHWFGQSVSISGAYLCTGAPRHGGAGSFSGAAYMFERTGSSWQQAARLMASDAAAQDQFGGSVALGGPLLVVGAIHNAEAGPHTGAAYVFDRDIGVWSQAEKLIASDAGASDFFAVSVATDGASIAANAPYWDSPTVVDIGAVYVFGQSTPPLVACPTALTVEADTAGNPGSGTAALTFSVTDPNAEVRTAAVSVDGTLEESISLAAGTTSFDFTHAYGLPSGTTHAVAVTVTGAVSGFTTSCTTSVTVVDTTPPSLTGSVSTGVLWPPTHKLVSVGLSLTVADVGDASPTTTVTVYSSPSSSKASSKSKGSSGPDAVHGNNDLQLRAEHGESKDGRIYLIVVEAVDAAGNRTVDVTSVVVPHSQKAAAISSVEGTAAADAATTENAGGTPPASYVRLTPAP